MVARVTALVLAAVWLLAPARPAGAAAAFLGSVDAVKPRAIAVDSALSRAFVAEHDGDLVTISTQPRLEVLRRTPIACCLVSAVADTVTHRVYVSGNGVAVVDGTTGVVMSTLSFGAAAAGALALSGSSLYVALPSHDQVAVVSLATEEVLATWNVTDEPTSLAVDGGALYVASRRSSIVQKLSLDSGAVVASTPSYLPSAVTLGGGMLWVAREGGNVDGIDAATMTLARSFFAGGRPTSIAYNPGNGRLWIGDALARRVAMARSSDGIVLGRMPVGGSPTALAFDAGLARVYAGVDGANDVVAFGEGPGVVSILLPFAGSFIGRRSLELYGAAPPGAPVTVTENGVSLGTAIADDASRWRLPVPAISEGTHTVVASVPEERPSDPQTFVVDLTDPVISPGVVSPAPNAAGWISSPVFVRWQCSDGLSGTATPQLERIMSFDGAAQTASATCSDKAGNQVTGGTVTNINIDKTPPVAAVSLTPTANAAAWNRSSPVVVRFSCSDALSGMAGPTTYEQTVTGQTSGVSVTFSCRDVAGNVRVREQTVRIDMTPPRANVDDVAVVVTPSELTGGASDTLSGPSTVQVSIASESASTVVPAACLSDCGAATMRWRLALPESLQPGLYEVKARAVDLAGNVGEWSAARQIVLVPLPLSAIPRPNLPGS